MSSFPTSSTQDKICPNKEVDEDIKRKLSLSPPLQYVTRQDSGVPEDLMSPCNKELALSENKDGSDSGVEGCTTEVARTSSCNGLDQVSCDSSLLSCYEEPCVRSSSSRKGGDSESSSVAGSTSTRSSKKQSPINCKKKSVKENADTPAKNSRGRSVQTSNQGSNRIPSNSRSKTRTPTPKTAAKTQKVVAKEPANNPDSASKSRVNTGINRSRMRTRPTPPDFLTLSSTSPLAKELDKDLAQRNRGINLELSRCTKSNQNSTPDDSRKQFKSLTKSVYQEHKIIDTYGTLPRRNKTKLNTSFDKVKKKVDNQNLKILPYEKTLIYHEMSIQTSLTGNDIENFIAGIPTKINDPQFPDCIDFQSQTEEIVVSEDELKKALEKINNITVEMENLRSEKNKLELKLSTTERLLTEERTEHTVTRQELQNNAKRILAILGTNQNCENNDSLLELESHFQESGQMVANQQLKIADLQSLCHMLNRDLEKSLAAQKALLQHQQEVEAETIELKEFLQLEKNIMAETMKDVENDLILKIKELEETKIELDRKTEECKHLVRISEQRYQENLSLEMKLNSIERKSKENQCATVSLISAGVALTGLYARLEGLIDQLVKSYKISEKDLEDVVYHNEAHNSSTESSPQHSLKDCTPSPKRNSNNFVSAVISAIRNAATTRPVGVKKLSQQQQQQQLFKDFSLESSTDLLDFETEPCLMMESVLEDVPLTDTYSRNMISSNDSLRRALSVPEPCDYATLYKLSDESSSLTNLTQAILNRRRVEENEADDDDEDNCESTSETENNDFTGVKNFNLVDQVIDVDNLVTKLLKVLRIIQLDNDTCIRELRDEKFELEGKLAIETKGSTDEIQWISADNPKKLSMKEGEMTSF